MGIDMETNKMVFRYFTYGACCSEVEIDCLTGDHEVPYHPKIILITVKYYFHCIRRKQKTVSVFLQVQNFRRTTNAVGTITGVSITQRHHENE